MEKIIVFGMGKWFQESEWEIRNQYEIIAILDNNKEKQGMYKEITVISPELLCDFKYDKILVVTMKQVEIIKQLRKMNVEKDKIVAWYPKGLQWEKKGISINDDCSINAVFDNIQFNVVHVSDSCIMKEIFFNGEYKCYIGEEASIVIDIGMNIGLATLFFANYSNVKKVYAFEPFKKTYAQAIRNIMMNTEKIADKISAFNYALSNYNGKQRFEYNEDFPGGMRIANGSINCSKGGDYAEIEIKEAGEILKNIIEANKDKKIIMKIDCEGSEYNIFESMEKFQLIDKIDVFLMETHDGREQEIESYLKKYHFIYFNQYLGGPAGLGMLYAVSGNK